jgi:hypothetical protein
VLSANLVLESSVEGQHGGCIVAYLHHLGPNRQEIQDPVAKRGVQSQAPELSDELNYNHSHIQCIHFDIATLQPYSKID